MVKDVMNVAVVSYEPSWGDKEKNIRRMGGFAECAAKRGADLVLFPETALIGYDIDFAHEGDERMHHRLAEPIPGPATEALGKVAKECGIYIVFGLSERGDDGLVYNAAAVVGPAGDLVTSYRKMHLPALEPTWAARGDEPCIFETPWGKIGLSICYDTYAFTEIGRYYRASGCRLHLNPCAVDKGVSANNIKDCVEFQAANNSMYIASANCTGCYDTSDFVGGANVIGPAKNVPEVRYYAGTPFGAPGSDEQELYIGTIDLSYVSKPFLAGQYEGDNPDLRPEVYIKMYERLLEEEPRFREK